MNDSSIMWAEEMDIPFKHIHELYCPINEANPVLSQIILNGKYFATYSAKYVGKESAKRYRLTIVRGYLVVKEITDKKITLRCHNYNRRIPRAVLLIMNEIARNIPICGDWVTSDTLSEIFIRYMNLFYDNTDTFMFTGNFQDSKKLKSISEEDST